MAALQAGDPQRIGPYVLLGRIGSGGMGRVYLARSPGGRNVAVKVIRSNLAEDAGFRARFAREVSAARKVGGLFTAQVVDADIDGPIPWLATAYVPGTPLSDAVERQGPLPEASVLALAAGLAEGLIAIHAAGVIHRDLKPSNVLLAQDGPRIIDFGISSAAEATALTGTGFMIGSPGFMSPEQAEGLVVGPSSDIFSLAGVLIYAVRGEGPFGTGDTAALLYRVVHGKPNMDHTPDKLRNLIKRSLSRDPRKRPSAGQFLSDLSTAYPSAADLTDWLPPRLLDPSMPGVPSHAGLPMPPGSGSMAPGSGSIAPGAGSLAAGAASMAPGSGSIPPGSGSIPPGAGSFAPGSGSFAPGSPAAGAGPAGGSGVAEAAGRTEADRRAQPGRPGETVLNPPTRTSLSHTPPPPTTGPQAPADSTGPYGGPGHPGQPGSGQYGSGQYGSGQYGPGQYGSGQAPAYPGQAGTDAYPGRSGSDAYPPQPQAYQQGFPGYTGQQGNTGQQGYAGQQQYPEPQGYLTSQGDPVAPGGSGVQVAPGGTGGAGSGGAGPGGAGPGGSWWAGQQPPGGGSGSMPGQGGQSGPGVAPMPGGEQWYTPAPAAGPQRKRPRWLIPVIAAAAVVVVAVVLVLTLGSNSGKTPVASKSQGTGGATSSTSASAAPGTGSLLVSQFRVGDCLAGSNMKLNQQTPWPHLTQVVPCSQAHLAEVIFANLNYFAQNAAYPGSDTIADDARAACDNAFQSYVGLSYEQSEYTWTDVVPGADTWVKGDRALHCMAYRETSSQPAGVTLHGTIRGSKQ